MTCKHRTACSATRDADGQPKTQTNALTRSQDPETHTGTRDGGTGTGRKYTSCGRARHLSRNDKGVGPNGRLLPPHAVDLFQSEYVLGCRVAFGCIPEHERLFRDDDIALLPNLKQRALPPEGARLFDVGVPLRGDAHVHAGQRRLHKGVTSVRPVGTQQHNDFSKCPPTCYPRSIVRQRAALACAPAPQSGSSSSGAGAHARRKSRCACVPRRTPRETGRAGRGWGA